MTKDNHKRIGLILVALLWCLYPVGASAQKKILADASGRQVAVPVNPQRIISLAPSITENLFALGLADRIVGVTIYCDYPAQALKKEKVGGGLNPSLEKIISLNPDLVVGLVSGTSQRTIRALERWGLPLYLTPSKGFAGVLKTIQELGELTGAQGKATALAAAVRAQVQRVARLTKNVRRPRVLFLVWQQPLWVVGRESFINDLIGMAGGISITSDIRGEAAILSLEEVVARAPEVILVSLPINEERGSMPLKGWERLRSVPAIRDGKVFALNSSLVKRPSYRLAQGLEELARILHPQLSLNFRK